MADPVQSIFEAMQDDPDRELLARFVDAWVDCFGYQGRMASEAVAYCKGTGDRAEALREVLHEIAGTRDGVDTTRVGRWIKRHAGSVVDGRRFEKDKSITRNADVWCGVTLFPNKGKHPDKPDYPDSFAFDTSRDSRVISAKTEKVSDEKIFSSHDDNVEVF